MPSYPFFGFPFPPHRRYNYNNHNNYNKNNELHSNNTLEKDKYLDKGTNESNNTYSNEPYLFDLFGIKLYFDDILIICLIFFLYNEGVKDEVLFFSLILLLLT